ncbi:MAG TPA: DUF1349 domain-containing protein [Microbacterium sp.]|nr:DUF1349 domain-containing protein [Microbacterium sp.]
MVNAIDWADGRWTHDPEHVVRDDAGSLTATAVEGSDAWLRTAYGFAHDTEHALLAPLAVGEAMEVALRAEWKGEFDQAGIFVRADAERWVKTGLEFADGHLQLGAVVTAGVSDWSTGHADEWAAASVTVRVSRWEDALIIRARADEGEWRLVRVAPFDGSVPAFGGPFLCGPTRAGFRATFLRWTRGPADEEIH